MLDERHTPERAPLDTRPTTLYSLFGRVISMARDVIGCRYVCVQIFLREKGLVVARRRTCVCMCVQVSTTVRRVATTCRLGLRGCSMPPRSLADVHYVVENGPTHPRRQQTGPAVTNTLCRYLHSKGVDFTRQNKGGNDPLSHAVAYGRRDIAAWLLAAEEREGEGEGEGEASSSSGGGGRAGGAGSGTEGAGQRTRRRRDDPHLLDLARLTGDEKMQEFLLEGT